MKRLDLIARAVCTVLVFLLELFFTVGVVALGLWYLAR